MRRFHFAAAFALVLGGCATDNRAENDTARAKTVTQASFVTVDGIRLHYVDHGGSGAPLILLAGMGHGAHVFDDFAPHFTDHFRVFALTRRGYGQSDKPPSGYDTETLASDLAGFMDALGMARASLIGHSLAGGEMTVFAGRYPGRTDRLVYLDAAYDREQLPELSEADPVGEPQPGPEDIASVAKFEAWFERALGFWSPAMARDLREMYQAPDGSLRPATPGTVGQAVYAGMVAYRPDYRAVKAPALALYAIQIAPDLPASADPALRARGQAFLDTVYAPWQREQAARFDTETACSKVVLLPGAHHYFFVQDGDQTARTVRSFLLDDQPCAES